MQAIFTNVGELQAVAELYQNDNYIADLVLPRVPTRTTSYRFQRYPLESRYTVPQTLTGRLSTPRRVQDRWLEDTGLVADYGLDHPIPMQDIRDANFNGVDMRLGATSYVTQLVRLDREIRVATVVFDVANYAAGLSVTLGAGTQWDDPTSEPVFQIKDALSQPLLRPNIMVIGLESWNRLCTHPQMLEAIRGGISPANNAATQGIVTQDNVARLFGLQAVYVGDARVNTANPGVTPVLARVFTDSCALLHINTTVTNTFDRIITWGYTVEFETIVAAQIDDPDMGLHGGIRIRVGESVNEQIVAPSAGYLFLDTVA